MNKITSLNSDLVLSVKSNTVTVRLDRQDAVPEKVIYNDPATIVLWDDGTKTVVKCHPCDAYDPEKGFLLCCAKKLMGNNGRYNDEMRRHVPVGKEVTVSASAVAKAVSDALWKEFKEAE